MGPVSQSFAPSQVGSKDLMCKLHSQSHLLMAITRQGVWVVTVMGGGLNPEEIAKILQC